jgi:hypothetical protein
MFTGAGVPATNNNVRAVALRAHDKHGDHLVTFSGSGWNASGDNLLGRGWRREPKGLFVER